ncbi:MAG: beta-propeller domain-containing protein [Acidimicrobiales bacterium]
MTRERDKNDDDNIEEFFAALDAPRPMPASLRGSIEDLLTGADPVAALARTGTDGPRALPASSDRWLVGGALGSDGRGRFGRAGLRLISGTTSPRLLQAVAVVLAVVLVAGSVALAAELSGRRNGASPVDVVLPPRSGPTTADLVAMRDCDQLLGHFRTQALALVDKGEAGAWTANNRFGGRTAVALGAQAGSASAARGSSSDGAASGGASSPALAPPAPQSFGVASGTNVQEVGVDEPDIVKVEPGRVFTVSVDQRGPVIRSLKPTGGGATLLGTFDLPTEASDAQLLLSGDRLLALATVWSPENRGQWTKVWAIDVSDPARLRLASTVAVEGSYTSARLVDGLVRIVIASGPLGPPVVYPSPVGFRTDGTAEDQAKAQQASAEAEAKAKQANAEAVKRSTLDDWVANYELTTYRNGRAATRTGRACACEDTLRPVEFSGFGSVTVLTIDPKDPKPDNVASVTGAAGTTYASSTDLFVASVDYAPVPSPVASSLSVNRFAPWFGPHETNIHQFSITEPEARYVASGKVPGTLLSQFSMSQHEGHLRVASTLSDSQREQGIDNVVSVLRRDGGQLDVVGQVAGLGAPGERIQGVRMMGDTGYVVTFRQVDPLYVVDLAEPTKPRVLGELKIPGVSTYLHPMGAGHLIGIGAEATPEGRRTGLGMSVFDVRDRTAPKRSAHLVVGPGGSAAERDHHAFLYWARTSTVVVPYQEFGASADRRLDFSAVVIKATPTQLTEVGRVSHLGRDEASTRSGHEGLSIIQRSAVIGDQLWTFSAAGVLINDLSSLRERAWVGFSR